MFLGLKNQEKRPRRNVFFFLGLKNQENEPRFWKKTSRKFLCNDTSFLFLDDVKVRGIFKVKINAHPSLIVPEGSAKKEEFLVVLVVSAQSNNNAILYHGVDWNGNNKFSRPQGGICTKCKSQITPS